jgi:hypothetical protein
MWSNESVAAECASYAITHNGCVRIMSQLGYPNALPAARVAERLREATEPGTHLIAASDICQTVAAWIRISGAVRHELRLVHSGFEYARYARRVGRAQRISLCSDAFMSAAERSQATWSTTPEACKNFELRRTVKFNAINLGLTSSTALCLLVAEHVLSVLLIEAQGVAHFNLRSLSSL